MWASTDIFWFQLIAAWTQSTDTVFWFHLITEWGQSAGSVGHRLKAASSDFIDKSVNSVDGHRLLISFDISMRLVDRHRLLISFLFCKNAVKAKDKVEFDQRPAMTSRKTEQVGRKSKIIRPNCSRNHIVTFFLDERKWWQKLLAALHEFRLLLNLFVFCKILTLFVYYCRRVTETPML